MSYANVISTSGGDANSASPNPLAGYKGPLRGGDERQEKGKEGRRKVKKGKGRMGCE